MHLFCSSQGSLPSLNIQVHLTKSLRNNNCLDLADDPIRNPANISTMTVKTLTDQFTEDAFWLRLHTIP